MALNRKYITHVLKAQRQVQKCFTHLKPQVQQLSESEHTQTIKRQRFYLMIDFAK